MPESFSVERRKLMAAYGATFELTPRELGMKGAIAKAREIVAATPSAWMPMQFDNPANLEVHKRTTAEEIARDFPDGLDYIFAGVGTGGHVTRRRRGPAAALAEAPGLRRRARALAGAQRRQPTARTRSRGSAPGSSRATSTPTP